MARLALIETASGLVENLIELEPGAAWSPPPGRSVVDALDATKGSVWDGVTFTAPPVTPVSEQVLALGRLRSLDVATLPPIVSDVFGDLLKALGIQE